MSNSIQVLKQSRFAVFDRSAFPNRVPTIGN